MRLRGPRLLVLVRWRSFVGSALFGGAVVPRGVVVGCLCAKPGSGTMTWPPLVSEGPSEVLFISALGFGGRAGFFLEAVALMGLA